MRPIRTYVFMDLETTGMPREENNTTRIAELSMIAVKREHLLDTPMGKCPRIQNKLTLCFNPCKIMSPEGSKITGLDNFLLEYEMKFNKESFELIDKYLGLLTQPVCLIAHNGNNFDYPILKNNMEKINVDFSYDIKCADCYFAFYRILDNTKNNVIQNGRALPETYKKYAVNENEPSSVINSRVKRQLEKVFNSVANNCELVVNGDTAKLDIIHNKTANNSTEKTSLNTDIKVDNSSNIISMAKLKNVTDDTIIDLTLDESQDVQEANGITPTGNGLRINNNSPSPAKNCTAVDIWDGIKTTTQKDFLDDEFVDLLANDPIQMQKINESTPKQKIIPPGRNHLKNKSKRRFPWSQDSKPEESYKLSDIYKRQLNREPPEAHRAENDCIMAMEIAVTVAEEFVKYVDEHNADFKDIQAMTIGVKL